MSMTSKLTARNQTTIPKAVVEALQIKPSSLLLYEIETDVRVLSTAKSDELLVALCREQGCREFATFDASISKRHSKFSIILRE